MANFTQKAIISTFEQMLVEMPFEKITVSSLVERCEISPNTFYYHYHNIYDLLDAWFYDKRDTYLKNIVSGLPWRNTLKIIMKDMKDNSKLVHHVVDSISRERIEEYIIASSKHTFYSLACERSKEYDIPEDAKNHIADFCSFALLGFFLKYIWENMEMDVDKTLDDLSELFNGFVDNAIQNAIQQ